MRNYLLYLYFPLIGLLLTQLFPPEKLSLRILVVLLLSVLGMITADADLRLSSVYRLPAWLGAQINCFGRHRPLSAARWMAFALLLLIWSALTFSPTQNPTHVFTVPALLMLAGWVAEWISLRCAPPPATIAAPTDQILQPRQGNLPLTLLGIFLLLAVAEKSGNALQIGLPQSMPVAIETLFFYGGILLVVLGLGGVRQLTVKHIPPLRAVRPRLTWLTDPRFEAVMVGVIFVAALFIRGWNLNTGLRVSVDEAVAIEGIGHYYGGVVGLVAAPSQYISTQLFPQGQGILLSLFGRSVMTLRLASAIVGALTVIATYFLARDLFKDRVTGVIACLLLMTFPPHIHFSRIALLHIADPLFGTLAVWFFIRAIQSNRRLDWALAGAWLGLTQYFFEAGRLFYLALVSGWLVVFLMRAGWVRYGSRFLQRTGHGRYRHEQQAAPVIPWRGMLIAFLAFFLVAMPTYYALFSRGGESNPRLIASNGLSLILDPLQNGLTTEEAVVLARRVLFPFTVYVYQPEIAVFYGGDQPLLLVYVVPFFLMGIGFLLWHWRSTAGVIILWLVAAALLNALLRDSAVYARWHVVFPAVAITVAVALRYLVPVILSPLFQPQDALGTPFYRRSAAIVVTGILTFMMIAQVAYYFGWHVPLLEKQARLNKPYPDVYDMAIRSLDFPNFTDIYQIGTPIPDINVPRIWIEFLTESDPATLRYFPMAAQEFTLEFVRQLPEDRNLALFVSPDARDAIQLMERRLGCNMQRSPYPIDPPDKGFLLCFVSRTQ